MRTLSHVQNNLLAFGWAVRVNAHEDARSPAKAEPAPARSRQRGSHGTPRSHAGRRHFRVNVSFCVSGFGAFFNRVGGTFNAHMKLRRFQSPGLIQKIHTNTMESVSLLRRMEFDTAEILTPYPSEEPQWLVCHI